MIAFRKARRTAVLVVCFAGLTTSVSRAAEFITLRSGFTIQCARHETLGNSIRLYTGQGSDYQELPLLQVAHIEFVPDPPKPIALPAPAPAASSTPGIVLATAQHLEADLHELLIHAGAEHNIDVELLASVIHTESGYKVNAVSRKGARGLMQLMPSTARTFGARDAMKAEDNIAAGTAFLDELLKRYNDNLVLALAAYNAGPGAVERYHGVPPFRETRAYVTRVINEFYRRKIALGATPVVATAAAETYKPAPDAYKPAAHITLASSPAPLALR